VKNNAVLVDAAAWIGFLWPGDDLHAKTNRVLASTGREGRSLLTTSAILLEVVDGLAKHNLRYLSRSFRVILAGFPDLEIVHVDAPLFDRAWTLFDARGDKKWSLTDCISFVLMRERGISDALTYDHHFEQAGFRALLRQN